MIIPLYEGESYIAATLDSLRAQRATDLEVIVVDDGSTDGGRRIAEEHPVGAVVVEQQNRGVAAARNRGALHATGHWLAFIDQDDLWHHERLTRMRPILEATASGFVSTTMQSFAVVSDRPELERIDALVASSMVDHWIHDADLVEFSARPDLLGRAWPSEIGYADLDRVLAGTLTTTTSFFVRADHLRLVGGWSMHARSVDDWWLMASSAYLEPIALVDEPSHLYRVHPGATSRTTNFWYAYSSSLAAIRVGGNFVNRNVALTTPIENSMAEHMLDRILDSPDELRRPGATEFTGHMASILWPGRSISTRIRRSRLKVRAPWIAAMRRRVRDLKARRSS